MSVSETYCVLGSRLGGVAYTSMWAPACDVTPRAGEWQPQQDENELCPPSTLAWGTCLPLTSHLALSSASLSLTTASLRGSPCLWDQRGCEVLGDQDASPHPHAPSLNSTQPIVGVWMMMTTVWVMEPFLA